MDITKTEESLVWGSSVSSERRPRKQTYYEILDVEFNAPRTRIREAYIRLKNTYSNNNPALYSLMSEDDAKDSLHEVEEAFRVLEDEILRKQYNQQMMKDGVIPETVAHLLPPLEPSRDPFAGVEQDMVNQVERLSVLRQQAQSPEPMFNWNGAAAQEPTRTHHTQRNQPSRAVQAQLPPIKTSREGAITNKPVVQVSREEMKQKMESILAEGDAADGRMYCRIRELLNLTLNDVQNSTKISLEYVIAIESNLFHKLPAMVYTRGFMKSYLLFLGVPDVVNRVNSFVEKMKLWQLEHQSDKL